jgi:hypothetical protein
MLEGINDGNKEGDAVATRLGSRLAIWLGRRLGDNFGIMPGKRLGEELGSNGGEREGSNEGQLEKGILGPVLG